LGKNGGKVTFCRIKTVGFVLYKFYFVNLCATVQQYLILVNIRQVSKGHTTRPQPRGRATGKLRPSRHAKFWKTWL